MANLFEGESPEGEVQFIDFKCPRCGTLLSFLEDSKGLAQECLNCMEVVIVPARGVDIGRSLPLPLATPRLLIRRLQLEDGQDLLAILADEEVLRYVNAAPSTEESIASWLKEEGKTRLTQPGQPLFLGIVLQMGGKLIGYLAVNYVDHGHLQAEINLMVNRGHHRRGYAKEAVRAALAFCFAGIGVHRVVAFCDSRNIAARRLLGSAGFRVEGEFVQDKWLKGEWTNTVYHGLLSSEYAAIPNREASR